MISIKFNANEFKAAIGRLEESFKDWGDFWEFMKKEKILEKRQTEHFRSGGPDPSSLSPSTIARRAAGLFFTDPSSNDFYKSLRAGNSDSPSLTVGDAAPRWVWTKNTMRSTFEPETRSAQQTTFDTDGPFNLYQSPLYDEEWDGPFVKFMPQGNLWDLKGIDEDLDKSGGALETFFKSVIEGEAA